MIHLRLFRVALAGGAVVLVLGLPQFAGLTGALAAPSVTAVSAQASELEVVEEDPLTPGTSEFEVVGAEAGDEVRVEVTRDGAVLQAHRFTTDEGDYIGFHGVIPWTLCRQETFIVTASSAMYPDSVETLTLRSPANPCARRFTMRIQPLTRVAEPLLLEIQDGWYREEVPFRVCFRPPGEGEVCARAATGELGDGYGEGPSPRRTGRYRVRLEVPGIATIRRTVRVHPEAGRTRPVARRPAGVRFPKSAATRAVRGLARRLYVSEPQAIGYSARCNGPARARRYRCDAVVRMRIARGPDTGETYRCFHRATARSPRRGIVRARFVSGRGSVTTDSPTAYADC